MSSPLFLKSSISHAKSFTLRTSVCSCVHVCVLSVCVCDFVCVCVCESSCVSSVLCCEVDKGIGQYMEFGWSPWRLYSCAEFPNTSNIGRSFCCCCFLNHFSRCSLIAVGICQMISLQSHRTVMQTTFQREMLHCARFLGRRFCRHQFKKKHIKTKLAVGTTELHCPQGVFFLFLKNKINMEIFASFPQKLAKLRYPKLSFLII